MVASDLPTIAEDKESQLAHYLGEHQQQAFFGLINIRFSPNLRQTYKIGSVVPFCVGKEQKQLNPSTVCLAMIVHIFKRFSTSSLSTRSERGGDSSENNAQTNNSIQNDQVQDLVTVKVYFHVSHMKSANEPKISVDNKKRIYAQPHKDEFVSHPTQITMTLKEFIARVKRGNERVDMLINSSSNIPPSLIQLGKEFCNLHDGKSNNNSTSEGHQSQQRNPKFIVLSEGLYNRIKAVEKIHSEGFPQIKRPTFGWNLRIKDYSDNSEANCDILRAMEKSQDLFFTGICTIMPHFAISKITPDDGEEAREESLATKSSVECKSSLQHIHRNLISIWPLDADTRIVFIRRQSNDFTIPTTTPSSGKVNFTPARIRRTRVRGTDQMAIKLRRPITIPENVEEDLEDPLLKSVINDGLLFEQFDSYSSNSNSPHVRCNSPMPRPRRSCGQTGVSYTEINTSFSTVTTAQLGHSHSDSNLNSEENQRNLRANPPVNKRISFIDKDLELAIQRSLTDRSKRRKKFKDPQPRTPPNTKLPNATPKRRGLTRSASASVTKATKSFRGRPRKMTKQPLNDIEKEDGPSSNKSSQEKSSPESSEGEEKPEDLEVKSPATKKEESMDPPITDKVQSPKNAHNTSNSNLNDSNEDAKTEPQTCCDDQVQMMYTNVKMEDEDEVEIEEKRSTKNYLPKKEEDPIPECKPLPEYLPPLSGVVIVPPPLNLPPDFRPPSTMWTQRSFPLPAPVVVDQNIAKSQPLSNSHLLQHSNQNSLSFINTSTLKPIQDTIQPVSNSLLYQPQHPNPAIIQQINPNFQQFITLPPMSLQQAINIGASTPHSLSLNTTRANMIGQNIIITSVGDNHLHLLGNTAPLQANKLQSAPISLGNMVNLQIPPQNFILNSNSNQLKMPFTML